MQDDELVAELVGPKYRIESSGRIKVESKDELKKRGLKSPNKADAFILTLAGGEIGKQMPELLCQRLAHAGIIEAGVGEATGALDTMLGKAADIYEREVDDAVASLSSLLEPLIMVVLGVLIGGLVVAMYLPIFKLGQVV